MVKVQSLRRSFGPILAVDGIGFEANRGEVVGILGPNGAGKSTAMKMLTCFLEPDDGTASVCGYDILRQPQAVRRSVGYLPENSPLYEEMTVSSFLGFVCDARGIRGRRRRQRTDWVVHACSLDRVMHQTVETLSKGYRRRVGLAQALIHDPDVLVLDEPTDGLDPNQKQEVRNLIRTLSADKCIIISTHILEEVEAICTRAIIMARGRILVDSTPQAIKAEHGTSLDAAFRKITTGRAAQASGREGVTRP